jgi:hypothetical protein
LEISLFNDEYDSAPKPLQIAGWPALSAIVRQHTPQRDKFGMPLWSPAMLRGGKKVHHVVSVCALVIDIDGEKLADGTKPGVPLQQLIDFLAGLRCAYAFATSFSYSGGDMIKGRVVIPLDKPCPAALWKTVWNAAMVLLGASAGLTDTQCKNANRMYFLPAHQPHVQPIAFEQQGPPLSLDALLRYAPEGAPIKAAEAEPGKFTVTQEMLAKLGQKLSKGTGAKIAAGEVIKLVCKGLPFAPDGNRDQTIFLTCSQIAWAWPDADPASIAGLFRASLSQMPGADGSYFSEQAVCEKLVRLQLEARSKRGPVNLSENARRISEAYSGTRDLPYTAEELARWTAESGTLANKWLLVHASAGIWVFFDGDYRGPFGAGTKAAVRTFLAPAISAGVELSRYDDKTGKQIEKTVDELCAEYGRIIEGNVLDLSIRRSYLDTETHTLVSACAVPRVTEGEYSADFDGYLRAAFNGSTLESVLDWLATVTDLSEPAPALILTHEPGSGKNMLAEGVARLWTENGCTKMESVLGNFNEALIGCPLIHAEERIPASPSGLPRTEEFRELITSFSRPYKKKFQSESTIRGAVRVVASANNPEKIFSKNDATMLDARAIGDRMIHARMLPNARAYLQGLGGDRVKHMVQSDAIARHCLYLRATRIVKRGARLVINSNPGDLLRELSLGSGPKWHVILWLYEFCRFPDQHYGRVDLKGAPAATWQLLEAPHENHALLVPGGGPLVERYRLLVNANKLQLAWADYLSQNVRIDAGHIDQFLRQFAPHKQRREMRFSAAGQSSRATSYIDVGADVLAQWCETTGEPLDPVIEAFQRGPAFDDWRANGGGLGGLAGAPKLALVK